MVLLSRALSLSLFSFPKPVMVASPKRTTSMLHGLLSLSFSIHFSPSVLAKSLFPPRASLKHRYQKVLHTVSWSPPPFYQTNPQNKSAKHIHQPLNTPSPPSQNPGPKTSYTSNPYPRPLLPPNTTFKQLSQNPTPRFPCSLPPGPPGKEYRMTQIPCICPVRFIKTCIVRWRGSGV
jgi:hypothetical protein